MRIVTALIMLASSQVYADQFSYIEINRSTNDGNSDISYDNTGIALSWEVDKNVAAIAGYEQSDDINLGDAVELINEGLGGEPTQIELDETYKVQQAYIGLKAFSSPFQQLTAYIDLKGIQDKNYQDTATGYGLKFGVLVTPLKSFTAFKVGAYLEHQAVDYGSFSLTQDAADQLGISLSLNTKRNIQGAEALVEMGPASLGAQVEKSTLNHTLTAKGYGDEDSESFEDEYSVVRLFGRYHF